MALRWSVGQDDLGDTGFVPVHLKVIRMRRQTHRYRWGGVS